MELAARWLRRTIIAVRTKGRENLLGREGEREGRAGLRVGFTTEGAEFAEIGEGRRAGDDNKRL